MMSSSDMSSDEESDCIRMRRLEEDPSKVNFQFLKTDTKIVFLLTWNSSKEGVLITHNIFKYSNNTCSMVVYVQL